MLKKLHLYYRALLSRVSNTAQRSVFSRFLTSMVIFFGGSLVGLILGHLILYILLADIDKPSIGLIIFLLVLSIVLSIVTSLSIVRVSNNMAYSRLSKEAYMNIKDLFRYRSLDYIAQREPTVSDLVEKEFVEGIQEVADIYPGRPIRLKTHRWIVDNVINSPEVLKLYKVDCKIIGRRVTAHNMLLLVRWSYILRHEAWFIEHVLEPRDCYKVKLIAKH